MKLKRESLPEKAGKYILERIRCGEYVPGGRVPTVRELSEILGISHVSAARSLRRLREYGFLISKGRAGTLVASPLPLAAHGIEKECGPEPLLYYFGSQTFQISAYHKNIYSHLQEEAARRHWKLLYAPFSKSALNSASQDHGAVGIILAFADYQIPKSRIPILEYGMFAGNVPSITPDNYKAGFDAGRLYVSAGVIFSSIYLISPERKSYASRNFCLHVDETWKGVRDALTCSGIPYPKEVSWNVAQQHVGQMRDLLQKIRNRKNRNPVLFLVATHVMAEEIALFLPPFGLSIPKDICIISFVKRFQDSHRIRLDNFDFNHSDMARVILDELDAIRSGHPVPSRIQLPMKFYPEGSCIPAFYRKNGISGSLL